MHRILLSVSILFFMIFESVGQTAHSISISNSTLVSTSDQMPFWLWANTDGKIDANNSFLNISELNAAGTHFFNDSNSFIKAAADLDYAIGNNSKYFQANQLYTRLNLYNWELIIGMIHNDLYFEGLSTSNGNIARSRNARPYPKIGIRVPDYKPVPFLSNFLSFKGEFDEGILNDDRFVARTHLHHKSFYLKAELFKNFSIQGGVEHSVMWGGTSQNEKIGKLPDNLKAYFKYIIGSQGTEDFPLTDQLNVAGNQYGSYQLLITKTFDKFETGLNISHPFEDFSGVNLVNWPDNIIGFTIKLKEKKKIITHFIYEYTNTRQQGIKDSTHRWNEEKQKWDFIHYDNYYNHGIYNSGITYQQKMMSSPLFKPVRIKDDISKGPESTRFFSHHIGLKGNIIDDISWKSMVTFIRYFGNWSQPNKEVQDQTSLLFNLFYSGKLIPFNVDFTIAGDIASTNPNRLGFQLGLHYNFNN